MKHAEDGRFGIARIVSGTELSDEEILQFVMTKWEKLMFFRDESPGDTRVHEEAQVLHS